MQAVTLARGDETPQMKLLETPEAQELVMLAQAEFPHVDKWVCEGMVISYLEGRLTDLESEDPCAVSSKYGIKPKISTISNENEVKESTTEEHSGSA